MGGCACSPEGGERRAAGGGAGPSPEDGAGHQPAPTGIVVVEQTANQLAGRVESPNRPVGAIEHPAIGADANAAEGEGNTARDRIADERWRVQRNGPI